MDGDVVNGKSRDDEDDGHTHLQGALDDRKHQKEDLGQGEHHWQHQPHLDRTDRGVKTHEGITVRGTFKVGIAMLLLNSGQSDHGVTGKHLARAGAEDYIPLRNLIAS